MIARRARLDAARPGQVRGEHTADGAAAGRRTEHRTVIDRLERQLLVVLRQQRLDLGHRCAGLGGEDQLVGLIQRDAGEVREVEAQVPLRSAADAALGAMADDLKRLALAERPLHGGFDILAVARFEQRGHGHSPFVPLPVKRGEGAERSEAGEGQVDILRLLAQPLTRLDAARLATLSPPKGRSRPSFDGLWGEEEARTAEYPETPRARRARACGRARRSGAGSG